MATHDTRTLPLADRVVELVPHLSASDHEPQKVELKRGEILFEQGTMGDSIYLVAEGEIDLVRELPTGEEEVLKVAKPGDYFGEMGPLFALPRSASAWLAPTPSSPATPCRASENCWGRRFPRHHRAQAVQGRWLSSFPGGTRLSRRSGPIGCTAS